MTNVQFSWKKLHLYAPESASVRHVDNDDFDAVLLVNDAEH
jgi:hypothetical protein